VIFSTVLPTGFANCSHGVASDKRWLRGNTKGGQTVRSTAMEFKVQGPKSRILSWLAGLLMIPQLGFSQACSLDPTFNPALNPWAAVYVVTLQPDGKILIGGAFYFIEQMPRGNVARLNPDGSLDPAFDPGTAADIDYVSAIAVQHDGKILIGGSFASSSGTAPSNLARLNSDGTVDPSFDPDLSIDGPVNAIVVQPDGKILLGGNFGQVDFVVRRSIARLNSDGHLDSHFDACVASSAGSGATGLALLTNGQILATGDFTFSTGLARDGIARLNDCGDLDSVYAVSPGINGGTAVYTLALRNSGQAILGGNFKSYHNVGSPGIAQLTASGTVDTSFNPGLGIDDATTVFTIALQSDGKAVIGGNFTSYDGRTRYGVARINPNGSLDESCDPGSGPDNSVSSLAIQSDGRILVAGKFTTFDDVPRNGLARLNGDTVPVRLDQPSLINGSFQFMFYGQSQAHYTLQASSNLTDWISIITSFAVTNVPMPLVDSAPQSSPKRFYRTVSAP